MSDDQLMANPQAFQHRSHGYQNPFRRVTVDDSTFGTRAKALDHIAYRAKRCRQASTNGSISWASEEETALTDENDREEAAKLCSQGWAQLRGFRSGAVVSTGYVAVSLDAWVIVGTAAFWFILPGFSSSTLYSTT